MTSMGTILVLIGGGYVNACQCTAGQGQVIATCNHGSLTLRFSGRVSYRSTLTITVWIQIFRVHSFGRAVGELEVAKGTRLDSEAQAKMKGMLHRVARRNEGEISYDYP
ncbi:hypothetical protein EDB84DRAFT_116614 [Lactarius hengduanensis]|nr:hypothetical protein EDB84DRAFT_116614 [Lactarius hengduanensis]